ncbi:MAG TPA: phosphopantetheine-binding protein [Amycolatopsis sp.]|nr:phosphopantetheine-binding protein [Amycolatopsis sp.]
MTDETATIADGPVLDVVSGMVRELLGGYDVDDIEITMDTTFHEDLELESIDLVVLADRLQQHYGEQVNLAEFLADKELDEVIELTVGALVRFVASRR